MFANGGGAEANPYYYVNTNNKLVPLDSSQLYDVLKTSGIGELTALIQNPDVTYSPATQELFRKIVGERVAGASSTTPNNLEFGQMLPDYLSPYSMFEDIGGFAKDTGLEAVEKGMALGSGLLADQGEPQDTFVSERYPFGRQKKPDVRTQRPAQEGLPGAIAAIAAAGENIGSSLSNLVPLGPSKEGMLRRGFSNPELAAILNRAQSGEVQDFEAEIEQLTQPDIVDTASVEEVSVETPEASTETPKELPTGTVEIRNIGPDYRLDPTKKLKLELEAIGKDEFGDDLLDPKLVASEEINRILDELRPAEVKVNVDKTEIDSLADIEEKFAGLSEDEISEELEKGQIKFLEEKLGPIDKIKPIQPILSIPEAAAEEQKEQDGEQPPPPKDAITRKLEEPGFFGSDRFLDFIRNVGGELTRTGQFGTGLSLGASKAAEERAARELMGEQEERDFASKLRLARAEADLEGSESIKFSEAKTAVEMEDQIGTAIKNFDEDERILSDINQILNEDINAPGAFGAQGFFGKINDKFRNAIGMGETEWENLPAEVRTAKILEITAQRSVRSILGESGKTISNLDRDIVARIFGDVNIWTSPAELKKILGNSRSQIIGNLRDGQTLIISRGNALNLTKYPSPTLAVNQPIIDRILKFNFDQAETYRVGDSAAGYIEASLAPS